MNYICEHFSSIDSTNEEAKRRYTGGDIREQLLSADFQSAGKGRNGRSFYSPENTGIYFSYLYPNPENEPIGNLIFVTTVAAVLVCDAIRKVTKADAGIKWVNDVYVNDKKVCGILAEVAYQDSVPGIIVGIGINLSTTDFPEEIQGIASSVGTFTDEELRKIKKEIIGSVGDGLWQFFRNSGNAAYKECILSSYREMSLVIGREVSFGTENETEMTGIATGIEEDGSLSVKLQNGEIRTLNSGEIHLKLLRYRNKKE